MERQEDIWTTAQLTGRWLKYFHYTLQADGDATASFDIVHSHYREQHRRYHTEDYLNFCLDQFEHLRAECEHPEEVETAIWFRYTSYEPLQKTNVEKSARLAHSFLEAKKIDEHVALRVMALLHEAQGTNIPKGIDAKILLDTDLAMLGQERDLFLEYERRIDEEFSPYIHPMQFRARRTSLFQTFLDRPSIFLTSQFNGMYESQAIENLQEAITRLGPKESDENPFYDAGF